jgi:branched-chain amino acid:cation transporter, LIVCS family
MDTLVRSRSTIWSAGLAMFSMFFGAGNIVFPLALGQFTQDKNFYGIVGLILTAVCVPLLGLMAMILYDGHYSSFFRRIGKVPGFVLTFLILGLIGPFGGIPRCLAISYATFDAFHFETLKGVQLPWFSGISCLLIFLFTYRPGKVLTLLGYVLTPLLLISLAVIVAQGFWTMPAAPISPHSPWQMFAYGLLNGYNTMDLLAAFFFSSVVLLCLRKNGAVEKRSMFLTAMTGSLIAAVLLSFVYVAFSFLAAGYSQLLKEVTPDQLLGTLAYQLLGAQAGLIASVTVGFACLTTEIALTAVFAEFLQRTLLKEKISYLQALWITLILSFLVSTLHFEGISAFLVPILQLCYPALIVLTVANILHKLYGFKPIKSLFYGTMGLTLVLQLF